MTTKLRRTGDGEYRATTPAGNEVEIYGAWSCGGWYIVRSDGAPIFGQEQLHQPNLSSVRTIIAKGFCD